MKKLLTILLVFALTLSFAACSAKKDDTPAQSDGTTDPGASQQEPNNTPVTDGKAWPDNEFTQKVPALPFTIESFPDNGADKFGVNFSDAAMEDGKAYGDALQEAGFSENVRGTQEPGENEPYTLYAANADGWEVEYECGVYGFGSLYITKP